MHRVYRASRTRRELCSLPKKLGLSPQRVAYVGDTSIDMQTANRAGMYAIGVTWGFRDRQELEEHGAKVIIDCPENFYR